MSGKIIHRPQEHECTPPRGHASTFFHPRMTSEKVGTMWLCDCGHLWVVAPYHHMPHRNRYWRPASASERKMLRATDTEGNE